jgi:hypothetical protein
MRNEISNNASMELKNLNGDDVVTSILNIVKLFFENCGN